MLERAQAIEEQRCRTIGCISKPGKSRQCGVVRQLREVRGQVVNDLGQRLGSTASLQVRPESPGSGWVRWVATDPGRRRKGLARAVVVGVLELAAQVGCMDAYLETRTGRLAAIALYMQLGFEPLIAENWKGGLAVSGPHVVPREVWARVKGALRSQAG